MLLNYSYPHILSQCIPASGHGWQTFHYFPKQREKEVQSALAIFQNSSWAFLLTETENWFPIAARQRGTSEQKIPVPLNNGDSSCKLSFPVPICYVMVLKRAAVCSKWWSRLRGSLCLHHVSLDTRTPGAYQPKSSTLLAPKCNGGYHKELHSQTLIAQLGNHQDLIYKGKNKAYSVNKVFLASEPLFSAKASERFQRTDLFILQNLDIMGRLKTLIPVWLLKYNTHVLGCNSLTGNNKTDTMNMLTQTLWRHKLNTSETWGQNILLPLTEHGWCLFALKEH